MILIDKPFASEFLIESIKEKNFPVISTKIARDMLADNSINWISEKDAISAFSANPEARLHTNSENSISWIENNLGSTTLPSQIQTFKNKLIFRELLIDLFPNYFFKGVKYSELKTINVENFTFPFIIKPAIGFFSLAVHKVNSINEWGKVLETIESEIYNLDRMYPKEVIDVSDFLIEEYIHGEEYAVDFDSEGEPIILNILHHVFSSADDVSDRVYSTSQNIIEKHRAKIYDFLKTIGFETNLTNFPAHVEVRVSKNGEIFPIEINPLRFGGWCTTGDLSWFAYGFNSYEYFLNSIIPNWDEIFRTRENNKYSIIVLDNNSGIKGS